MNRKRIAVFIVTTAMALLASGCSGHAIPRTEIGYIGSYTLPATPAPSGQTEASTTAPQQGVDAATERTTTPASAIGETVHFTLETVMENGFAFKGVGGAIDGVLNPDLRVAIGTEVQITLVNGDGMQHDLTVEAFGVKTSLFMEQGAEETLTFVAGQGGEFEYFCSVPGHKQAGMVGTLMVEGEAATTGAAGSSEEGAIAHEVSGSAPVEHGAAVADAPNIAADPNIVPAPTGGRAPQTVRVNLETIELDGQLADGTTYRYWTFNGTVPGPMVRVQLGDTVEVHLQNAANSGFAHSVDFHAATGYLGGGEATQTAPGEETVFTFQALNPGVYVYHCATPMVAHHIANGMYGLIVVEPEGGLPPVDREFYVMQGEIYSTGAPGDTGHLDFDLDAMLAEEPNYLVFNGSTGGASGDHALHATVGETVRIYVGVGGPNLISSFHVIGEIFDRVYDLASLTSAPLTNVQTALVPPGGATVVEFTLEQPGTYLLVDHALSRAVKGLVGQLIVEGEFNPTISNGESAGPATEH
jgi:nitrite reductase (NO-forming)